MKFAIVNEMRHEPKKGLVGICSICGKTMIAKCGSKKIHHWAHKGKVECDRWWENESEWHRIWKESFPLDWQEVIQYADDGEKHIADIKTDQGWVIEFQHSFLNSEERISRIKFYKKLIWVIDGKKLRRDEQRLKTSINRVTDYEGLFRTRSWGNTFLKQYCDKNSLTFFDFGDSELWMMLPKITEHYYYLMVLSKDQFLNLFLNESTNNAKNFELILENWLKRAQEHNNQVEMYWREKTDNMHKEIRYRKNTLTKIY